MGRGRKRDPMRWGEPLTRCEVAIGGEVFKPQREVVSGKDLDPISSGAGPCQVKTGCLSGCRPYLMLRPTSRLRSTL